MTNVVRNGYYPVSLKCLEACSSTEFVDNVYVFNGYSSDDTVEKHQNVNKVKIIDSVHWSTNEISQRTMQPQFKFAMEHFSNMNEKAIVLILSSDIIFSNEFKKELKNNLITFIKKEKLDFMNLPYVKVVKRRRLKNIFNSLLKFWQILLIRFF